MRSEEACCRMREGEEVAESNWASARRLVSAASIARFDMHWSAKTQRRGEERGDGRPGEPVSPVRAGRDTGAERVADDPSSSNT